MIKTAAAILLNFIFDRLAMDTPAAKTQVLVDTACSHGCESHFASNVKIRTFRPVHPTSTGSALPRMFAGRFVAGNVLQRPHELGVGNIESIISHRSTTLKHKPTGEITMKSIAVAIVVAFSSIATAAVAAPVDNGLSVHGIFGGNMYGGR